LPYHETKEHGHNFPEPAPELIEGQPEWEVEEILNSRQYRHKLQYLIKWKGYSDAYNSWEPKENVTTPVLLAAYHEQNTAAIRKLKTEQADCSQRMLSLESKGCTAQTSPQATKHPLGPKRQTDKRPLEPKGKSKALDPNNCTQNGNWHIKDETKTQFKTMPIKVTGFVQKLRAILLRPLRKPYSQEKTTEEPEECECSICKRNKGAVQGVLEPLKIHIPALMTIRSIRISQERHRISNTSMIQEDGWPTRRTPETRAEKTTEMMKSYQGEERGQNAKQQKQDKKLTGTREQGTSCPIPFTPYTAHYPHMHGSPCAGHQQHPIHHNYSSSASSPMTVSGVDTSRTPCLPCTPSSSATAGQQLLAFLPP